MTQTFGGCPFTIKFYGFDYVVESLCSGIIHPEGVVFFKYVIV